MATKLRTLYLPCVILVLGHIPPIVSSEAQSVPQPRAYEAVDRLAVPWWAERHNKKLEEIRQHANAPIILIGDSITQNYEKSQPPDQDFAPTWEKYYGERGALNLGFSGDTTSNVLWRLQNGEAQGLSPKVVILLIGTNNTGVADQSAEETEGGIDAVIRELERSFPSTRILLLGILPSAVSEEKSERDRSVNRYLAATYDHDPCVTYRDIGTVFQKHDKLITERFYDPRLPKHGGALHPDTVGQQWMANAIEPTLKRMLKDANEVSSAKRKSHEARH